MWKLLLEKEMKNMTLIDEETAYLGELRKDLCT